MLLSLECNDLVTNNLEKGERGLGGSKAKITYHLKWGGEEVSQTVIFMPKLAVGGVYELPYT